MRLFEFEVSFGSLLLINIPMKLEHGTVGNLISCKLVIVVSKLQGVEQVIEVLHLIDCA